MADRGTLEATLNERGIPFDYYASDEALQELVDSTTDTAYNPAPVASDRADSELYLKGRGIDYDAALSDEELAAHVLELRDADHARYLEHYQPVVTRLPGAVGTSPEQPEPVAQPDEAAPAAAESQQGDPADVVGVADDPGAVVEAAPAGEHGLAQPEPGATGE